jgi:signal transduction histidine kinase
MRWLPIRWRLTLFHAITMAVIMAVLILAMFAMLGYLQEERLEDSVSDCSWIGESSLRNTGTLDPAYLASLGCDGVTIAALDGDGRILSQVGYVAETGEIYPGEVWRTALETGQPAQGRRELSNPPPPPPPAERESGEPAQGRSERDAEGGDLRFAYAIPVTMTDPPVRVIVASTPYSTLGNDDIFLIPVVIAGVAILALIVIVTASYFLVRSSLAPVAAITDTARAITASDLSRRLPVKSPRDELGRLSTTINDLLARLEVAFGQREQALAEQRRFVADASHELRTPLTSILGYTRMLRQWGLDNPDTAREGITSLELEAERMHRLIDSLLRLARGDEDPALSKGEHDLAEIVSEAVTAVRAFADAMPDITVDVPDAPVRTTVDRGAIVQVIEVLLDNAVKYGGSTTPIAVALRPDGDSAVIRVTDHGPGIAPEHLAHIFDRFYRVETSRTTRGSGLGLAIAKQIVTQHDGTITAASKIGEGTTFTVTLPTLDEQPQTLPTLSSQASEP